MLLVYPSLEESSNVVFNRVDNYFSIVPSFTSMIDGDFHVIVDITYCS